jgi:hypothetical protein
MDKQKALHCSWKFCKGERAVCFTSSYYSSWGIGCTCLCEWNTNDISYGSCTCSFTNYVDGLFAASKKVNIDKYLNIFVVALACGILQYIKSNYGYIDLSASRVFSFTWLYLGSFAGIYICFYLAKIAIKWKYSTKILAIVGKYSFDIMALLYMEKLMGFHLASIHVFHLHLMVFSEYILFWEWVFLS